jgi:hypothetical protein
MHRRVDRYKAEGEEPELLHRESEFGAMHKAARGRFGLKLAFLDPQVTRELGLVAANLVHEALSVPASNDISDGVAEWVIRTRAEVGA